jgi:hypothetical protein
MGKGRLIDYHPGVDKCFKRTFCDCFKLVYVSLIKVLSETPQWSVCIRQCKNLLILPFAFSITHRGGNRLQGFLIYPWMTALIKTMYTDIKYFVFLN